MKKVLLTALLATATFGVARAHDDVPGPGWMTLSQVAAKLHHLGFSKISKIEADDGLWKAKGYLDGAYTKVKLDPYSGRVVERHLEHEHHDDD